MNGITLIRIRMNPHSFSKLDPDPHKVNADPQHWAILLVSDKSEADIYVGLGFFTDSAL
jgi:hypothetical protein